MKSPLGFCQQGKHLVFHFKSPYMVSNKLFIIGLKNFLSPFVLLDLNKLIVIIHYLHLQ